MQNELAEKDFLTGVSAVVRGRIEAFWMGLTHAGTAYYERGGAHFVCVKEASKRFDCQAIAKDELMLSSGQPAAVAYVEGRDGIAKSCLYLEAGDPAALKLLLWRNRLTL